MEFIGAMSMPISPSYLGEISSDLSVLNSFHESFPWIPNESMIRPTEEVKEIKRKTFIFIDNEYDSLNDYIAQHIFGAAVEKLHFGSMKYATVTNFKSEEFKMKKVFKPNEFPYKLLMGNHYVYWYGFTPQERSLYRLGSDSISEDISMALLELIPDGNFNFAWYLNPKMTIPEFFHVQVFWISTK